MAERGYILPVWFAAAAMAAVQCLRGETWSPCPLLELEDGAAATPVPVEAVAPLADGWVMGTARSDPGTAVLDLTRGQSLWAMVRWREGSGDWLELTAGEGIGVMAASGQLCISSYARGLFERTLRPFVPEGRRVRSKSPRA